MYVGQLGREGHVYGFIAIVFLRLGKEKVTY